MAIYSFYYQRHFESEAELKKQLEKDGILKKETKAAAVKPKEADKEKEEVTDNG